LLVETFHIATLGTLLSIVADRPSFWSIALFHWDINE